jgi:hypothetical protein
MSPLPGWNFGVSEKLRGEEQNIDITEDFTGEPHTDAKEHVPMYVNEVGHSKELVENVLSLEQDNRVVRYYFHTKDPLTKGQEGKLISWLVDTSTRANETALHLLPSFQMRLKLNYNSVSFSLVIAHPNQSSY